MAHRLHGQKRMDDVESKRFTDALGLPVGWLDLPRAATDIPETVLDLLVPTGRRNASSKGFSVGPETPTPTADKTLPSTHRPGRQIRTLQKEPSGAAAPAVTQNNDQHTENERTSIEDVPIARENRGVIASATTPDTQDAYPSTSATSLETLQGIPPIAEALIKTLAGKARTGRLDEIHALQLLQQAILL